MLEVLTQPAQFFRALSERKPNLTAPFLLAVVGVGVSLVAQTLLTRLLPNFLAFPVQLVFALVGGAVLGIVFWGVGGAVIRLIAGPESRAWEVYGWSYVPGLLLALVLIPLGALWPITGNLPPLPAPTDPEALRAWQREYTVLVGNSAQTRVIQVLGLVSTFWTLWVLFQGLRVLAPARAAAATGVVGVILLAITAWGFLAAR